MSRPARIRHPYISRLKSVCGGEPVIRGTRFPERSVVEYALRQGMAPEEIVREWRNLSLAQVYDALSYYHDHKGEIDSLIRRHQPASVRRRLSV
jgi:uncharacterized protein (DUF433 family)